MRPVLSYQRGKPYPMNLSPILSTAIDAAKAGGAVAQHYFTTGISIRSKASHNLVSDADLEAEEAVVGLIRNRFSDHAFFGEETYKDEQSAEHLWIIDPIDGTNNFAHAVPHFACSVAYVHQGIAQAGAIFNPVNDDLFYVERGGGAFYNGSPAHVSQNASLSEVLVGCGFYYDRGAMMEATLCCIRDFFSAKIHGIRRIGAASLDLCYVGTGRFGAYFEYKLEPWDFAAGALFVEEAGGSVSTAGGDALRLSTTSILASNTKLHSAALDIVKRHHP